MTGSIAARARAAARVRALHDHLGEVFAQEREAIEGVHLAPLTKDERWSDAVWAK